MNEIQPFHISEMQSFVASLQPVPLEVGDLVLGVMQKRYGMEFNKKFDHEYADPNELRAAMCEILAGLNQEDIYRGLMRMRHQKYCPSLSVFRELCEDWKGENEAWADALTWRKNKKHQITVLTKKAYDTVEVMFIDTDNNNTAARNLDSIGYAFREVYRSLVDKAKCANQHQEMYVPPAADEDDRNRYKPAPSADVRDLLSDNQKAIVTRQQQLVAEGMTQKAALNKARRELYQSNINKQVELDKNRPERTKFQKMIQQGYSPLGAFENRDIKQGENDVAHV